MLVRISLVQHAVGRPLDLDLKLHLFRQRPDFVCFPEYWGAAAQMTGQADLAQAAEANLAAMARLSSELCCVVVGGTVVRCGGSGLLNVAPVFDSGHQIGAYAKTRPTDRERSHGIVAGSDYPTWMLGGLRVGIAICADCLDGTAFEIYGGQGIDLLFVPNASPYREGESPETKFERDETIFVAGAKRSGAYVIKTCGVGTLFGGRLQGRTLVAAPWGILHRVPPDQESRAQVITVNLSIDELREFRNRFHPARASVM